MRIERTVEVNGRRLRVVARVQSCREGARVCRIRVSEGHYFRDMVVADASTDEAVDRAVAMFLGIEGSRTMSKSSVKVGEQYLLKVGRNDVRVTLVSVPVDGPVTVRSLATKKTFKVAAPERLRLISGADAPHAAERAPAAPAPKRRGRASKGTTAAPERATRQEGAPQAQETGNARKTGLLDAAIQVLRETGQPMNTKEVVEAVLAKGLWKSDGKTPAATLYSSILREIQKKGEDARFVKAERGKFSLKS